MGAAPVSPSVEIVQLPDQGRLHICAAAEPTAVLVLGHGAGGGVDVTDLAWLASDLPERGITVVRHEQPWRALGGRVAWPPARLDEGWAPAARAVAERWPGLPVVTGGRSAGARVASRGAANPDLPAVAGVVTLAFPLHPPGRPDTSRIAELLGVPVPVLAVVGERDPFGTPAELRTAVQAGWEGRNRIVVIPGAGHPLIPAAKVLPRDAVRAMIADAVATFVLDRAAARE